MCVCDLLSCVLYQHLLLFVPTAFLHVQVSMYTYTEVKHSLSIHCGLLCLYIHQNTHTHSDVCACPCMLILLIFFHPLPPSLPPSSSLFLPLPPLILRTLYGLAPMDEQPKLNRSIAQLSQVRKFLIVRSR